MKQLKAKFSNGMEVVQNADGELVVVSNTQKTAQKYTSDNGNMPKDMTDGAEGLTDIPRDESVGFKQTEPKEITVYRVDYEPGEFKTDDSVVPRASDDGLGGPKTKFEPETGTKQTSGNPDSYVQKYTPSPDPTPAGDKGNHAVAKQQDAQMKKMAQLEQELSETKKALQHAQTQRERERVARKLVQAEIEKGLIMCESEEEAEKRIASMLTEPTAVLNRELQRVRTWMPSAAAKSQLDNGLSAIAGTATRKQASFADFGGNSLQSLGFAANHVINDAPASYVHPEKESRTRELARQIQKYTQLGKLFPDHTD